MKLGIDIGGTFTDLVLLNEADHKIYFGKTLPPILTLLWESLREFMKLLKKQFSHSRYKNL
ncbi:MAG: hypothetical protein IPO37_03245 [Saprospiraceae bacterium]|nr:hypothetical protein [Saprospiraceae bacterium]